MIKAIFFDMDNTLLSTQELYEDAHGELAQFINRYRPLAADEVIATARKFEVALFDVYAYGAEMLPQAFENTLLHYAPQAGETAIDEVRRIANNVYARVPEPKPGAQEALALLAPHFDLYIITAGDREVQQQRIDNMPFRNLFADIFIVPEKNAGTYEALLGRLKLQPGEAVMVGDSLRSDIIPATEAGLPAIHIESINWHGREMSGLSIPGEGASTAPGIVAAAGDILVRAGLLPPPAAHKLDFPAPRP
jgi:putative hydrolase of the HAD superfamily